MKYILILLPENLPEIYCFWSMFCYMVHAIYLFIPDWKFIWNLLLLNICSATCFTQFIYLFLTENISEMSTFGCVLCGSPNLFIYYWLKIYLKYTTFECVFCYVVNAIYYNFPAWKIDLKYITFECTFSYVVTAIYYNVLASIYSFLFFRVLSSWGCS